MSCLIYRHWYWEKKSFCFLNPSGTCQVPEESHSLKIIEKISFFFFLNFFSVPGKTKKSDRNSCSHQLCECDREFAMCLQKYLPCPNSKAMCKSKQRLWQNVLMGVGSGNGVHNPYKHHKHHHHKGQDRFIQHKDIHGKPHHFKPAPLIKIPQPVYPVKGLRLRFGWK